MTDYSPFIYALAGGLVIGLAVTLMLLFKGRVAGISGITYNFFKFQPGEWTWRGAFLLGLIFGGFVLHFLYPESLQSTLKTSDTRLVIAGLLVGFGTLLGNGCTSGHGVCGISRFSLRSITATMTFMIVAILTVYIFGVPS